MGCGRCLGLSLMAFAVCHSPTRGQENQPPPVVAVFLIENRGSPLSEDELVALTDYLGTKLGEHGQYQIIPREEIRKRLAEQKKESYRACYDQSCQIEVGRELAAQLTVSASVSRVGSQCIITSAMYELRKAATRKTASAKGLCTADQLLSAVEQIADKLRGKEAETKTPEVAAYPPPKEEAPVMPPRKLKKAGKSPVVAGLLSILPGGGMFYLGRWGWGITYAVLIVGGVGASVQPDPSSPELTPVMIGLAGAAFVASVIHSIFAALDYQEADEEAAYLHRGFCPIPAFGPGRDSHPAVVVQIFSQSF